MAVSPLDQTSCTQTEWTGWLMDISMSCYIQQVEEGANRVVGLNPESSSSQRCWIGQSSSSMKSVKTIKQSQLTLPKVLLLLLLLGAPPPGPTLICMEPTETKTHIQYSMWVWVDESDGFYLDTRLLNLCKWGLKYWHTFGHIVRKILNK